MTASDFTPSDLKHFWAKVNITSLFGCWLWTASTRAGYGAFTLRDKTLRAHRVSWIITCGDIPRETPHVCHDCPGGDNRLCVNPAHLFLGTHTDNMRDRQGKGITSIGSRNGTAKLDESDIPKIRVMIKNGIPNTEIGRIFGVCDSLICQIKKGKLWRHVTES